MSRRIMFLGPAAFIGVAAILDISKIDPLSPLRRKLIRDDVDVKSKLILRKRFELFQKIEIPKDLLLSADAAKRVIAEEIAEERRQNPSLNYLVAFENVRNRQLAAGQLTFLDGWPFAPIEIAMIQMSGSDNDT